MEVMSRLFRHTSGMVSTVVDGNEAASDTYCEQIPALTQFCLTNCEQLRGFPKSLTTWNTDYHFFSPSQVLDFGRATGTPIPSEVVPMSASRSDSVVSEEASATPRLTVDLGDPSYFAVPVVLTDGTTHDFLRLIRVVARDMVVSLNMANIAGFVSITDLVPLLTSWG